MSITPYRDTPLKRALLHLRRHGRLRRSNSKKTWTGTTREGNAVHFKDLTIATAGECGLIKITVYRNAPKVQSATLTEKGVVIARAIDRLLTARALVERALPAEPKLTARERAGRVIEEALS